MHSIGPNHKVACIGRAIVRNNTSFLTKEAHIDNFLVQKNVRFIRIRTIQYLKELLPFQKSNWISEPSLHKELYQHSGSEMRKTIQTFQQESWDIYY